MKKNNTIIYKSTLLLCFVFSSFASYSQEILIKNGDQWSFYDKGYLEDNWYKNQNFQNWKTGNSPLGYGDDYIATIINYGNDKNNKEITKYFTKKVTIKDITKFKGFEFRLQRDDGAVIYVNGKELYRDNMPSGHITKKNNRNSVY